MSYGCRDWSRGDRFGDGRFDGGRGRGRGRGPG